MKSIKDIKEMKMDGIKVLTILALVISVGLNCVLQVLYEGKKADYNYAVEQYIDKKEQIRIQTYTIQQTTDIDKIRECTLAIDSVLFDKWQQTNN